jgi:hypothetical protein
MTRFKHGFRQALPLGLMLLSTAACSRFPLTNWPIEDQMVEHEIGNSGGEFQQYGGGSPYFHEGIDILDEDAPGGPWVINLREGTVSLSRPGPGSLYNGVIVTAADGDQYVYWHLDDNSIQAAVEDADANGTVLPAGTQMAQLVTWTSCSYHHLHYEVADSAGSREPILTIAPREDTTSPILIAVSFVQNATNTLMPNDTLGLPIVSGQVDIIAHAYDTQFGTARTGVLELRWFVEDTGGTVVVPETAMRFHDIPPDSATVDAFRNSAPFDSDSNYCGTENSYYVLTNVDGNGDIIADATGLWDTTALANGTYQVHVTAEDQFSNEFTLIRQVTIDN